MKHSYIKSWSTQAAQVREGARGFKAGCENPDLWSLADTRKTIEGMMSQGYAAMKHDDDVFASVDMAGIAAEMVSIARAKPSCTLLYIHGGSFCLGNPATARTISVPLARQANATVYVPGYRLAPEHPFPAGIDDCFTAYRFLIETAKVEPTTLFIGGDSCGANLAYATLLRARAAGLPMPQGVISFSPWMDLTSALPSFRTNARLDDFVNVNIVDKWVSQYMGASSWANQLGSPLGADLEGTPSAFIACGSTEVWHDDADVLARKLDKLGIDVEFEVWMEMPHVWPIFAGGLPEADAVLDHAAKFMLRNTGRKF